MKLQEWQGCLWRLFQKWHAGKKLSQEEVDFLVTSSTALSDDLLDWLRYGNLGSLIQEYQQVSDEQLAQDRAEAENAWQRLSGSFDRQLSEAAKARSQGRPSNTATLNQFYEALNALKQAVKKHSRTPKHRQPMNAERDKAIYSMHRAGKNWAQIANDLPKVNREW